MKLDQRRRDSSISLWLARTERGEEEGRGVATTPTLRGRYATPYPVPCFPTFPPSCVPHPFVGSSVFYFCFSAFFLFVYLHMLKSCLVWCSVVWWGVALQVVCRAGVASLGLHAGAGASPCCASQMGATKRRRRHRHRRLDSFIYLQTKDTNWLRLFLLLLLCGSDEASDMCVTKGCAVDSNNNNKSYSNNNNMGQNNSNSRHGSGFDLMPRCRRR